MTTLDAWRIARKLTYRTLGEKLGVSMEAARRYCNGERIPSRPVMIEIYRLTAGAVQPNAFYDLPDLSLRAAAGAAP